MTRSNGSAKCFFLVVFIHQNEGVPFLIHQRFAFVTLKYAFNNFGVIVARANEKRNIEFRAGRMTLVLNVGVRQTDGKKLES